MTTQKTYTISEFKSKLASDPQWAERAIVRLFEQQTPSEQDLEVTAYHNSRGFNGVDAEILSSFAKRIIGGRSLTTKQLAVAYKKLPKYARQLHRLAYPDLTPAERRKGTAPVAAPEVTETKAAKPTREQVVAEAKAQIDPEQVVLEHGQEYWLGAVMGTFDAENGNFHLGNTWIDRHLTVYANCRVSMKGMDDVTANRYWKNEFAQVERQQEEKAYRSELEREAQLLKELGYS